MLNLKLFSTLIFSSLVWSNTVFMADYSFKSTIDLKKYGSQFIELSKSRSTLGRLDITLQHNNAKKETYSVKLGSSDYDTQDLLKIDMSNNRVEIGGHNSLPIKENFVYAKEELISSFNGVLKDELLNLLKKIDSSMTKANSVVDVKDIMFTCKTINSANKECELSGKVNFVSNKKLGLGANKDEVSLLKEHLIDVKKEMSKSAFDYDISGYREFLDKCESLVKNALESMSGQKKKKELIEVRRMIISERVDSYEYTAIRAKSIVGFVDTLMNHI